MEVVAKEYENLVPPGGKKKEVVVRANLVTPGEGEKEVVRGEL